MNKIAPYPIYKDSGVEWLGEVPEHWEVQQLGRIGRFSKGGGGTKEDEVENGIPEAVQSCIRYGDLYTHHQFFIKQTRSSILKEKLDFYTPIHYGDILFAGSGETIQEIGKSAVNLISEPACCGGDVIIFRSSIIVNEKFFGLATDCPQAKYQKSCMGRGITVMHIYADELKYMAVALPPLPEQEAIVRYLDYVGRRVRRLTRAKRKLVALLTEQKQAVIHRAVTRGLDPDVPMKDSGVEWLGEVPEHWEVRRLGRIGTFFKGNGGTKEDEVPKGVPCVRYGDLYTQYRFFIESTKACVSQEKAVHYTPIHYGDVLFAGSGETIEEIGKSSVSLLSESACCGGDVIIFRPSIAIDSKFLGLVTNCPQAKYQKSCMGRGITVMHIYGNALKHLSIVLPPLPEQAAIVEYLDKTTADIDTAIARVNRETELLDEYRTRLIADVVTGKLDVREAAAALPNVDPLADEDGFNADPEIGLGPGEPDTDPKAA